MAQDRKHLKIAAWPPSWAPPPAHRAPAPSRGFSSAEGRRHWCGRARGGGGTRANPQGRACVIRAVAAESEVVGELRDVEHHRHGRVHVGARLLLASVLAQHEEVVVLAEAGAFEVLVPAEGGAG